MKQRKFSPSHQSQPVLNEMFRIIFILALAGPIAALDAGSSVWFYSCKSSLLERDTERAERQTAEECKDLQWSLHMPIDRRTCWANEKEGIKDGARRRSFYIDPPLKENSGEGGDHRQGCLKMWKSSTCTDGPPTGTMSFNQARK